MGLLRSSPDAMQRHSGEGRNPVFCRSVRRGGLWALRHASGSREPDLRICRQDHRDPALRICYYGHGSGAGPALNM